jgi:hypothetical protein
VRAQGDGGSLRARAGAGIGPVVTASGVGRGAVGGGLTCDTCVGGGGGNSGALVLVCRVRRSVNAFAELRGRLAAISWTYFQGEMLPGLRGAWGCGV